MSEQDNLHQNREAFEAFNAHDAARWAQTLDEGFVWDTDTLPASVTGREAAQQTFQAYFNAFPDLHFDIEQELASGDFVVARWRATGTHQGELMSIPPTNRPTDESISMGVQSLSTQTGNPLASGFTGTRERCCGKWVSYRVLAR